jgi:signal transduction histidine kinase
MAANAAANAVPPGAPPSISNALSLARVESAIARSGAGIGIVFFLQSLPALLGQLTETDVRWSWTAIGVIVVALLFAVFASLLRRLVRIANLTFAAVFLVVLISWPFAVIHPSTDSPWLYYLITIATAMAAIGTRPRWAGAYLIVTPTLYAVIRLMPAGGALQPFRVILDSTYAIVLGGAILVILTMLRTAATAVDHAQATALSGYAHAVRAHAMEAERVRVDAIVHDSVLTTLLYAARADTPEAQHQALTMASNAIGHLRDAALAMPNDDSTVRISTIARRTREEIEQLNGQFDVTTARLGTQSIPAAAAEAIQSATMQAAVNSLNHAGEGAHRSMHFSADGGVRVVVRDDGRGFDMQSVPAERLGVRVSIIERMANVGGRAEVVSEPGAGTVVTIRWPARALEPDGDELASAEEVVSP